MSTLTAVGSVVVAACQGRWEEIEHDWNNGCLNPFNQDASVALESKVLSFYKGSSIVRQNVLGTCSIFGTIWAESDIVFNDIKHEFGHSAQERFLGPMYLCTIVVPSVLNYFYGSNKQEDYYSMPWERTADWLGGVCRESYKNGALVWAIAENLLGPVVIPFYYSFGY